MTKLTYYTPRSRPARLFAPLVATAASYLPPRTLRPIVKPCVRCANHSRRPNLRRAAARAIDLVVGDGMSIRVTRRHQRRA
jgi:hypothetical protein